MQLYTILTIIISICALFAYINARLIKLPPAIGIMVLSLLFSVLLITAGKLVPSFTATVVQMVGAINFHRLLMQVMLSFLLFAGSIHINAAALRKQLLPVALLSTLGTLLSAVIVAMLVHVLFSLFGMQVPIIYCLLFGILISPTDPVAVLAILKQAGIPSTLQLKIAGESLFNDGVAVVVFISLLEVAQTGTSHFSLGHSMLLFMQEAGGGLLFGFALGYAGFLLVRSIDNYQVEVLITVAIVMGGYTLADVLHVSGPLAMIVAGIVTGNTGKHHAMSETAREYLDKFWELVDEIMNAILFLLIGLQVLVIPTSGNLIITGIITIGIVLLARWISVALPVTLLRRSIKFEKHAIAILTWGGLRGGLSVAMALSLPAEMFRSQFVAVTYIVVIFSIVVQGLTIKGFTKYLLKKE
jgi:CPA1 family monovalent cation:H+ antiporter